MDEALPEYMRTQARLSASTSTATSDAGDEPESPAKAAANAPRKAFKRSGGALEPGREIEVVHELLLIALGLGQYRAEDGATTLWEQEALFGDALPPMDAPSTVSEGKSVKRDPTPKIDTYEVKPETREGKAPQGVPQVGAQVADGATKAWGSLKAGATSFGSLVSGNKSSTSTSGSSANHQNESTEKAKESKNAKSPVKPNEVCHYDARARALIAVAVMSMGVGGAQVFMAEKVVAQVRLLFLVILCMWDLHDLALTRDKCVHT